MRFWLFPLTTSFLVYFFFLHLSLRPPPLFPLYFSPSTRLSLPCPFFPRLPSLFCILLFPPYFSPLYSSFFLLVVAPSLPLFPARFPLFTPFSCSSPPLYTLFLLFSPSLPLSCSLNPFTPFSCFLPPLYPLGCARSDCATHSGTLGGCQGGSVQELVLDQTRHFFIPLIIVIFRHTNQPVYLSICLSNLKIKRF